MTETVFERNGKWYFWDETWKIDQGPFDSYTEAQDNLYIYLFLLEQEENGWHRLPLTTADIVLAVSFIAILLLFYGGIGYLIYKAVMLLYS